jgi:HAD superfamily hydrolase (TIGR01509 family)
MVRAVIFDVDGTLVDTVDLHAQAWRETFEHFDHDIPFADIRGQIGKGGDQLLPVFLSEDEIAQLGEEIEAYRGELYKRDYISKARPFPQVRELFERLRACGQRVVLASSGKGEEVEHYQELLGIGGLVDAATTSDDAESSKPHPDIFEAALAKVAPLGPTDAVVVGDTPYDAEAARKAGIRAVGVLCGGFPEADLRAAGCVAIYRDPADLLRHYERSPLAGGHGSRTPEKHR